MATSRLRRLLTVSLLLPLIGNLVSADAITGRVVDQNGVGVAGVDIDFVVIQGSGNPHEANDGTDANGNFVTTVDPGIYEIRFYAPTPPATTLLTGVVKPVVVVGTVNMGTIVLEQGVSLQGRIVNPGGLPVAGVKVTARNDETGLPVLVKSNTTNAFGTFNIAVPLTSALYGEVDTRGVIGQTLAPRELLGPITGPLNVGDIPLEAGFHLTGVALQQNGVPIQGADIDVLRSATGNKIYTPHDNTSLTGAFDVVVPADTYDIELAKAPGTLVVVGREFKDVTVNADVNLGPVTMPFGVVLTGVISDPFGAPVQAADVNVREVSTGLDVFMDNDNANAFGVYSVVVPTGPIDIVFQPPWAHGPFDNDYRFGVTVTPGMNINATVRHPFTKGTVSIPSTPGGPKPSSGATVTIPPAPLTASGPAIDQVTDGTTVTLSISGGLPQGTGQLLLGRGALSAGSLPLRFDARGEASVSLPAGLLGEAASARVVVRAPLARDGFEASRVRALRAAR